MSVSDVTASSTLPPLSSMFSETVCSRIPKMYLEQIEFQNRVHASDKSIPTALVLISEYDHNGAFYNPYNYMFLHEISKTHRISIEIIKDVSEIKQNIDKQVKPVDLLVIDGHGDNELIQINKDIYLKEANLDKEMFKNLSSKAIIFLNSCHTGNGLAQKIAEVTHRKVFAPTLGLLCSDLAYSYEGKCPIITARDDVKEYMLEFDNGNFALSLESSEIARFDMLKRIKLEYFAECGDVRAQLLIGDLYKKEGKFEKNTEKIEKAKEWYLKAANNGNQYAQYYLALIYIEENNFIEARKFIKKLILSGIRDGYKINLECKKYALDRALELWAKDAENGNVDAQFYIGFFHDQNESVEEAKKWYLKAANNGNQKAQYNLALIYEEEGNLKGAREFFTKLILNGIRDGYKIDLEFKKHAIDTALKLWSIDANKGNAEAQFYMGLLHDENESVKEAKEWYLKAAKNGVQSAQYNLALIYEEEGNLAEARELFTLTAMKGNKNNSVFEMAKEKAITLWSKEINTGNDRADFYYEFFKIFDGNQSKIRELIHLLAKRGNQFAKYNLALVYKKEGKIKEALKLFSEISEG